MIREKKSQLNNIFISILLFLTSLFAYIILKTKGFGSLTYIFDNLLNPYINTLENILVILIVLASTYLFTKLTSKLIRRYLEERGRTKRNIKLLLTVYKYFVW